jgi:hypothetical protein
VGTKHREIRKALKAENRRLKALGWKENELGELIQGGSKAQARWAFYRQVEAKIQLRAAEWEITGLAMARATADIQAIEDARVFESIEAASGVGSAHVGQTSAHP